MNKVLKPVRNGRSPGQMSMVLDPVKLMGLSGCERGEAITVLAQLLTEAAGVATEEHHDDGR